MRLFFYALLFGAFGAFVVGCADLEYVDDYSDSTFYDEEYAEEEVDDGNKYAQEEVDEEVVEFDDEEIEVVENEQPTPQPAPQEPQKVAQPKATQPAPVAKPAPKPAPAPQPTPTPKPIDSPKVARDSRPAIVPSAPSSTSKVSVSRQKIRGKGFKGLTQSTAKLKSQCENNGNIQKCEDLGRIYALRGNIDSAVTYYERACDNGNGSALSCFFLSQIYANDGDSDTAQHYTNMIDESALRTKKVGSLELRLSTGKVESVKRSLKMSCTKGDEGSCNTLQSIFKMRGELSEMKTYFGTECWRGSALGCTILRSM